MWREILQVPPPLRAGLIELLRLLSLIIFIYLVMTTIQQNITIVR